MLTKTAISLRKLTLDDAKALLPLLDDQSCINLAIKPISTLTQAERFISTGQTSNITRLAVMLNNRTLVGYVAYRTMHNLNIEPKVEISYLIGQAYRKNLIAYYGLIDLFDHLQDIYTNGCNLQANTMTDNLASQRLLEKLGFILLKGKNFYCKRYTLSLKRQ